MTRFNESIDEALTEAVKSFTETTEHYRDQSLGILGHDLRNPLSGIVMGSTLLINSQELSDKSVRIAARMLSSAKRMDRMIGDLLDLTRTRFGDLLPVLPAPIDLSPLCQQVVAELEGLRSHADRIGFRTMLNRVPHEVRQYLSDAVAVPFSTKVAFSSEGQAARRRIVSVSRRAADVDGRQSRLVRSLHPREVDLECRAFTPLPSTL